MHRENAIRKSIKKKINFIYPKEKKRKYFERFLEIIYVNVNLFLLYFLFDQRGVHASAQRFSLEPGSIGLSLVYGVTRL